MVMSILLSVFFFRKNSSPHVPHVWPGRPRFQSRLSLLWTPWGPGGLHWAMEQELVAFFHRIRVICRYIYLCKNHKKSTIHVGKYMRNTWMIWGCFELDIHIYHIYLLLMLSRSWSHVFCSGPLTSRLSLKFIKGTILVLFILVLFIVHNAPPWYHLYKTDGFYLVQSLGFGLVQLRRSKSSTCQTRSTGWTKLMGKSIIIYIW